MRRPWFLTVFAVLCVGGAVWLFGRARGVSSEALLASARGHLEQEPPDRLRALRELDEALRLTAPADRDLRAEILHQRSRLFAQQGMPELALEDCRTLLAELGSDADALERASELCLWLREPVSALDYANALAALDPGRGKAFVGRARVALADAPLAALERMAETALPASTAREALRLGQRAAVFAADESVRTATEEELAALFQREDERRLASEWVREAAEHLEAARMAFVASLEPGSTSAAIAGLQDLFLRGGAPREAADLGRVALALPNLTQPMPVLARTASALAALGRLDAARALVTAIGKRSPGAIQPYLLPSNPLRDELQEWCLLLARLALWEELRPAASELVQRTDPKQARGQLALYLLALADLRGNRIGGASWNSELIGTRIAEVDDLPVKVWSLRAEVARAQGQLGAERYALLQTTKATSLDPPLAVRDEVGRAHERLAQLQLEAGERFAAEVSLTHALRCSPQRGASLEERWRELGQESLESRGVSTPFALWLRARSQADRGAWGLALGDARALLKDYPGLGPALEVVADAAEAQRDFPLLISTCLELVERGWPSERASARLQRTPAQYFLPQDRVRWMQIDPRASLERVLRHLLARGDVQGAAMAARAEPARLQPRELLPFLARIEVDAGLPAVALETLALLEPHEALFQDSAGLVLRAALMRPPSPRDPVLERELARVLASGTARDPALVAALDAMLASGRLAEAGRVLAWLEPQTPPFLGEVLLRGAAWRAATGAASVLGGGLDDGLERATALLDDGRPELGRLVLAHVRDDGDAVAREARAVLATPFAATAARRAALLLLAGDREAAEGVVVESTGDGRDALLELADAVVRAERDGAPWTAALAPRELLVLGLAGETPAWAGWALARTAQLEPVRRGAPWVRALRARAWLALGLAELALSELDAGGDEGDARIAWLRVRTQRARGRPDDAVLAAQVAWFRTAAPEPAEPWLARVAAAAAEAAGEPGTAARLLTDGLERWPDDPTLLAALAQLEDVPGRRARAVELQARLHAAVGEREGAPLVLPFLDLLRRARDDGEITEARWWSEVEALEAVRPLDPAPVRELAARALERPEEEPPRGADGARSLGTGRIHALARLERFRARVPDRSLESLRAGETLRWVQLLARYVPDRALALADSELRRDTDDPALWRASAEALLAAGRWPDAMERLEALQRVAPERDTARLLALTGYRIEGDAREFLQRVEAIERLAPEMRRDPLLVFYSGLASADAGSGVRTKERAAGTLRAHELWQQRDANGLDDPDHGRALALAMFEAGRPAQALVVLGEAYAGARTALEGDLFAALGHLIRSVQPKGGAPRGRGHDGAAEAEGEGPGGEAGADEPAADAAAGGDAE